MVNCIFVHSHLIWALKKFYKNCLRAICMASVFLVTSLSARAQTPTCSAASKFYSKDSINVTTFGASTVAGVGGFSFQGYLQQNIENCYAGKVVTVTTNGVYGETTTQGLTRFPGAIQGRTGFLMILMGANDAQYIAQKKMRLSDTERNMRYYLEEAMKHGLIPIIGTIQWYNDANSQALRDANLYVKQINTLYKRLAAEYHIYVADINMALGRDFTHFYQDGVHPNEAGYRYISTVWFDALNRAIEDKLLVIGVNQNYPNPVAANGLTKIGYSLSQASKVELKLYNMMGAQVMQLDDEYQGAGYHEVQANLINLKAGLYIYVLKVGGQQFSKKLLYIK